MDGVVTDDQQVVNVLAEIRAILGEIQAAVGRVQDPVARLELCRDVYPLIRDTAEAIGPKGLRGQAARDAIEKFGSAELAVHAVKESGDETMTRATMLRLAEGTNRWTKKDR